MPSSCPDISVVIACYNSERFVGAAIASMLKQTYHDIEVLALDDGSTDRTLEILGEFASRDGRVKAVALEHSGISATLNQGLKLARGRYVAQLDSDDIAVPHRLERQYEFLERNSEYVAVGSNIQRIDEHGLPMGPPQRGLKQLVHDPKAFPPRLQRKEAHRTPP